MSHRIAQDEYTALQNNVYQVPDPGASGTIVVGTKGRAICELTSAGAESRALESATNLQVGVQLKIILVSDGGTVTISEDSYAGLDDEGDMVCYEVSKTSSGKVWKRVYVSA